MAILVETAIMVEMARHGQTWPYMAIHGHAWPCMAMHGQTLPYMAVQGHAWPDMAIISSERHSKSKKLYKINETPKSKTKFRCAKFRKNPETKVSRFLPYFPLIWAFQILSRISNDGIWRDLSFHIKKFLISCPVAWYSAVFVFKPIEIHGNPWKSM